MPLFTLRIALESTFIYKVMKLYYQNTKRYYRAFQQCLFSITNLHILVLNERRGKQNQEFQNPNYVN